MNPPILSMTYLLQGFTLILKPGLKRYVAIPLLINIFIFAGLFFLAGHFINVFNIWFTHYLPSWLHWLSTVLWLFFLMSFLLIVIYTFVTLTNLVAAPFNSLLSEKVEWYLTGKSLEQRSLFENIRDVPRILGRQLAIIGYYLPRALLLLILFFIPIIHLAVVIIWFLFNAWFMSLTYFDYPTDNHRVPLNEVRAWMQERRLASLGFGVTILVASMVPLLNLFIMPAAVAAATKFWLDESVPSAASGFQHTNAIG